MIIICFQLIVFCEEDSITFIKTFAGEKGDYGKEIIQAKDGGYVFIGKTYSYGNKDSDIIVIKIDKHGNELWRRLFGGSNNEGCYSILEVEDGYLILGYIIEFGKKNTYLIKINDKGAKQFEKVYNSDRGYDAGKQIIKTFDNNYVILGEEKKHERFFIYLLKIDQNGGIIWKKDYCHKDGKVFGRSIIQADDGDYYIAGYFEKREQTELYVLKVDKEGSKIWDKRFGSDDCDKGDVILQSKGNKDFIILGRKSKTLCFIKINAKGEIVTSRYYIFKYSTCGGDIKGLNNDEFILTGMFPRKEIGIFKIDKTGNIIWRKYFGSYDFDEGKSVSPTKDGGFIILAETRSFSKGGSDFLIIKTDERGQCPEMQALEKTQATRPAKLKFKKEPNYPEGFKKVDIRGIVILQILIDCDGKPKSVVIYQSCGNEKLDKLVLDAGKQCQFEPALNRGTPVEMKVLLYYEFNLED